MNRYRLTYKYECSHRNVEYCNTFYCTEERLNEKLFDIVYWNKWDVRKKIILLKLDKIETVHA